MISFDDYADENNRITFSGAALKTMQEQRSSNSKWPCIPDHPYRTLIIGGSESGKTYALLNLINNRPDIDKIYLYAKYPHEAKYQFVINKWQSMVLNHFNDPKAFIDYLNDMQDVYKNIDKYNTDKEGKILIVFDDMTGDMINNKKLNSIVTELLIRGKNLNISLAHSLRFQKMLD